MNDSSNTIVATTGGKLEGSYEDNLYVFKGIPYAAPPVGVLRWMPPQPVKPWDGVRPAKKYGAIPPQNEMLGGIITAIAQVKDEDCLYLNIWTSGLDDAKRPVMVWIHGGAFTMGSGTEANYRNPSLAARGNIVLVTINYRLGMLGFLNLKEATGGKISATGNEGLLDQIAALRWVRENIAAFGGDPDNVTAFGESAGGMSIGCLMAMPAAKGSFDKGILESGVGSTAGPLDEAVATSKNALEVAGIKGHDVEALRSLSVKQLLDIEMKLRTDMAYIGEVVRITATAPVIDGDVLPGIPTEVARAGSANDIPTIIGTNLEEWKLFGVMQPGIDKLDEAGMIKRLNVYLPEMDVSDLVKTYREARQKRGEPVTAFELLSAIQTDLTFHVPALELVEAQRDNGQSVYNYLFTWKSPAMGGFLGACHGLEIGFVFGGLEELFHGTGPDAEKLSRCIQDAWLAFAHTGNPSCESIGEWPVYGNNRATMMLGKPCHIEEMAYEDERSVWDRVQRKRVMP
jgi:para-nitrobenzyl esterase